MTKRTRQKTFFIFLFFLLLCGYLPAQEENGYRMAFGPGVEWNMNADREYAAGAALGADFNLSNFLAAGLSVGLSGNFNVFTALESAALFRWYVFGRNRLGFYLQADAGLFLYMEDEQPQPMALGGVRAGLRLPLGRLFYIEPYARGGYPFVFSVGMSAGVLLMRGGDSPVLITATGDRPARLPDRSTERTDRGTIFTEMLANEMNEEAQAAEAAPEPVQGRYYVVRWGDTLWHLAIWVYGDAQKWRVIAAANGDIKNPDVIIPGQRLYIPPDEAKR